MSTTTTTTRPYQIREGQRVLATARSYYRAQVAVARRIASDVEGRVLEIHGPHGITTATTATNTGLGIDYTGAQA